MVEIIMQIKNITTNIHIIDDDFPQKPQQQPIWMRMKQMTYNSILLWVLSISELFVYF